MLTRLLSKFKAEEEDPPMPREMPRAPLTWDEIIELITSQAILVDKLVAKTQDANR
jgi:hypothetical protein